MLSLSCLVCITALTLSTSVHSSSIGSPPNYNYDLSGSALTELYNSPVYIAERMMRPLGGLLGSVGVKHSGVRVTLGNGDQYLIHKGSEFGKSTQTVVVRADRMSDNWEPDDDIDIRDFEGSRTVADFVAVGGSTYTWWWKNCHRASRQMMNQ